MCIEQIYKGVFFSVNVFFPFLQKKTAIFFRNFFGSPRIMGTKGLNYKSACATFGHETLSSKKSKKFESTVQKLFFPHLYIYLNLFSDNFRVYIGLNFRKTCNLWVVFGLKMIPELWAIMWEFVELFMIEIRRSRINYLIKNRVYIRGWGKPTPLGSRFVPGSLIFKFAKFGQFGT